MGDLITRYGYRCNLCPAYKGNIHSTEDQERTNDGWFRIYGFRIPSGKILCDGCSAPDGEKPKLIDSGCPVRPCVVAKGLRNCAYCDEYPCGELSRGRLTSIPSSQIPRNPTPRPIMKSSSNPTKTERCWTR